LILVEALFLYKPEFADTLLEVILSKYNPHSLSDSLLIHRWGK